MHILPPYADDTRAVRALTRVAQRLIPRTESTTEDGGDATYVFAATHVAHVIHILQVLSGTLACFDASIVEEDATLDWDVLLPACLRHNDNEEPQGAAWPSTICAAVHTVNERHKDASAATRLHCVALLLLSYLLDDFRAFVHPEELMEKLDASMGKPMTASGEPLAE